MVERREYLFSGTLGDAFIALCKLHDQALDTPCSLRRICSHKGLDSKIGEICALFKNIDYSHNYIHFDTIDEMRVFAYERADRYINIFFDSDGRGNEPDDPKHLFYNPHPAVQLEPARYSMDRKTVGINLNSGARAENRRLLDVSWVADVCHHLQISPQLQICLLGTGEGYSEEELYMLSSLPGEVTNLIGTLELTGGLSVVAGLDYFISPEGLLTFFAASQRVQCFVLYQEPSALLRMHPAWHNLSVCMRPRVESNPANGERWTSFRAEDVATMLLARLDPESLSMDQKG